MKPRARQKIRWRKDIFVKGEKAGYIQLVSYICGDYPFQLEYHLEEPFRNQGIMTRELPKYLKVKYKWAKDGGITKILADVEKANAVSKLLLIKNGFVKLTELLDREIWVLDLLLPPETVKKATLMYKAIYTISNY